MTNQHYQKSSRKWALIIVLLLGVLIGLIRILSHKIEKIREDRRHELKSYSPELVSSPQTRVQNASDTDPQKAKPEVDEDSEKLVNLEHTEEQNTEVPRDPFKDDPLMPVCRRIEQILYARPGERLQQEAKEGQTSFRSSMSKLFKLTSGSVVYHFMMRLPHNRNLIFLSDKEQSLLLTAKYTGELLLAGQELEDNLEQARLIENQSYRAYFIAKVLISHPDLIGDGGILEACSRLSDDSGSTTLDEMNRLVYQVMERAQTTSQAEGFNPNWQSKLVVKWSDFGAVYRNGLFEELHPKQSK